MILADMWFSSWGCALCTAVKLSLRPHNATLLPSVPMILMMAAISCPNAKRGPAESPDRGRISRIVLRRRRGPLLQPVGGLAADRDARGGDRHDAGRAPSARGRPDGGGNAP